MKLNRYLVEYKGKLFNTIDKKIHPKNEKLTYYENNLCLEGQEKELILNHLLRPPQGIWLSLIASWECSLRCSHCSVLHKLKKKQEQTIDAKKLGMFLNKYQKFIPITKNFCFHCLFVGGEVGIQINNCLECLNITEKEWVASSNKFYNCTTNLFYELTDKHLEFFQKLQSICVSLDGLEISHNSQRKKFADYTASANPFKKTLSNLETLIQNGNADKITIQASLEDDVYFDTDEKLKFFELLLRKGIKFENIKWRGLHPTTIKKELNKVYQKSMENPKINFYPCCKYRYMSKFIVNPENKIYTDYFESETKSFESYLGNLDDEMQVVAKKYENLIVNKMPILQDKNCMACPVLGYCWGKCVHQNEIINVKPSENCNQEKLIKKVEKFFKKTNESS